MKISRLLAAGLLLASDWPIAAVAQPAAAPAAAPAPAAPLNAPQFAALSAMNTAIAPLNQALTNARDALTRASLTLPTSEADLRAKADAVAKAELDIATARANAIAPLQAGANRLSAAQLQALNQPGGRGGRGGGATVGLPPTVSPGAVVEKLATLPRETYTVGMPFTEGATSAPNGDIYFVEQNSSKIMKWSVASKTLSVFMHPSGYANGMSFDYKGNLIVCADERNEIWSVSMTEMETIPYPAPLNPAVGDPDRPATLTRPKVTVLVNGSFNGKLLGGPNDVWCAPNGDIYFSDPYYARSWWTPGRQSEQDMRTVYFLSADRKTLRRAVPDFNNVAGVAGTPNGIIGTRDGKTLFVANINGGETYGYDIQPDGSLTNKRVVAHTGSDGMTLDNQGNLYVSSGGVSVYSTKTGQLIGVIPVPEGPANMAFGGPDHSTLYITARTGFYSIPTNVKGENPGK